MYWVSLTAHEVCCKRRIVETAEPVEEHVNSTASQVVTLFEAIFWYLLNGHMEKP